MNKYGRIKSIYLTDFLSIIATIIMILPGVNFLIIGRMLSGLCVGFNSCLVPLYNDEITPKEIKPSTEIYIQFFICSGTLIAWIIGLWIPTGISDSKLWVLMILLPILFNTARSFGIKTYFSHETPKYLIAIRKEEEAKSVLSLTYLRKERVEEEY